MKNFSIVIILAMLTLTGCHNNRMLAHTATSQHKVITADSIVYQEADDSEATPAKASNKHSKATKAVKHTATKKAKASTKRVHARNVKQALMAQYRSWKHVRYQLGGQSRRGIDCSGFTQQTFKDQFKINLPRDSRSQVKVGSRIQKKQLKAGDLVFFKIGRNTRHVGIYVDNNQFLHASTSKGVILSKIDSAYWSRHYWTSIRVSGVQ